MKIPPIFTIGACRVAGLVLLGLAACTVPPESLDSAYGATESNAVLVKDAYNVTANHPGAIFARSVGISMHPTYDNGSIFVIVPTKWEDLSVDQVIAYKNTRGQLIVHRLVHNYGDAWLCRGDNNQEPDRELVTPQNLVGVVATSFPPPEDSIETNP